MWRIFDFFPALGPPRQHPAEEAWQIRAQAGGALQVQGSRLHTRPLLASRLARPTQVRKGVRFQSIRLIIDGQGGILKSYPTRRKMYVRLNLILSLLYPPHFPPRPKDFTHTAGKTAPRTEPNFFTPLVAPTHGHLWNFEFKLFETFTNIS